MNFLVNAWHKDSKWLAILKPLSLTYRLVSQGRRRKFQPGNENVYNSKLPVIVVGNITVGGTGKTPLIIYLAKQLQKAGYNPGIVSRGYQSKAPEYPFYVKVTSNVIEAGDEALVIAQNTLCPVIIDADRASAIQVLENKFSCDVVLSDDGLQHYKMDRDIEIVVIDGQRGFGNGRLLPEGPLRELPKRLEEVDYLISNGATELNLPIKSSIMSLKANYLYNIKTGARREFDLTEKVHALAGIGNPERFFSSLCACGFDIITHIFKDHHAFSKADITFDDGLQVVMTEKDAIKCTSFATDKHWYLQVDAVVEEDFIMNLLKQLKALPKTVALNKPGIPPIV